MFRLISLLPIATSLTFELWTYGIRLRVFFLPAFPQDLNPDEWVWSDLKAQRLDRPLIKQRQGLDHRVRVFFLPSSKVIAFAGGLSFRPKPSIRCCFAFYGSPNFKPEGVAGGTVSEDDNSKWPRNVFQRSSLDQTIVKSFPSLLIHF